MIPADQILPGAILRHELTGHYFVKELVNMRLPDGTWVRGALYTELYSTVGETYVRSVTDFGDPFTLVELPRS